MTTPTERASAWLAQFEAALASGKPQAVSALFDADCYWRDLVSFTWNIRTQEGQAAIEEMLAAQLATTAPSN